MKSARDLYGSRVGQLAFVIGCGPSIKTAEKYLNGPHKHIFRIALNAAIEKIPAEFWFWIDGDAYLRSKEHPNAKAAVQIGVDHFAHMYGPEVYVWERALKYPVDIEEGKLVHRATSLIAAISMAGLMGAIRIVTVGCDNQVSDEYLDKKAKQDPSKNWRDIYNFTFSRINDAFRNRRLWLPSFISLADASGGAWEKGGLLLPQTFVNTEFRMLDQAYALIESGKAKMELPDYGSTICTKN